MKTALTTILLSVLTLSGLCENAWARKHPQRIFNEPVRLDESGRPLYNSWERQEFERRERAKQRKQRRTTDTQAFNGKTGAGMNGNGQIPPPPARQTQKPDQTISSPVGSSQAPIISQPGTTDSPSSAVAPTPPTDNHTIDPTKIQPTPTQPSSSPEPAPTTQIPPHTQDSGF